MDRQLLERMVGAAVLIVALVVIAPAILDGPGDQEPVVPVSGALDRDVRTVTIRPDREAAEPPVPMPSAAAPAAAPAPKSPPAAQAERKPSGEAVKPTVAKAPTAPPKVKPKATPKAEPPPKASPPRSGWAVQLGSFASRDNAKRLAGEVSAKGYETYLLPLERDGRTLYRVRVGPRPSREAAEKLAGELARAGYKGQLAPEGQAT